MIKAILFDNFGVITSVEYWSDVEDIAHLNGHDASLSASIEKMNLGKITWKKFCQSVAEDLGINDEEVERRYNKYRINRQVIALARRLKENYIVAIASNAHHEYLEPVLEATSLDKVFEPVYISSQMGVTKPDPRFYNQIARDLKVRPEECLMIDDSQANIAGAEAAGMQGLLFENVSQLEAELERHL